MRHKHGNGHTIPLVALLALSLSIALLPACAVEPGEGTAATATLSTSTAALPPTLPPSTMPTPYLPSSPPSTPSLPEPPPADPSPVTHTVQKGDTLLGLARQYGVPMAAIQLQNSMGDSTVVQMGQVLSIPPRAGWESASAFWVVHVVREGETLVGIANSYGLKAAQLKAANDLADADLIRVGQDLVLPLDAPAAAQAPAPAETPTRAIVPTTEGDEPSPSATTPAPPAAAPPADVADWPRETVRLINQVRAEHGLPPLAYDETLARAAQGQANDCAQRGWCSHTGSDGSNIKTRIVRVGYAPTGWAECWAQRQTPQGAVDIWMDEVPPNDPHRRTLLTTWLSEIGVGVAQTAWGYYFIADFGRP